MKKPEITPGPWSWQKRGKHGAVCMLNAYQPPGFAKNVLEVYGHIEPANANAKAIAALPDLLEALEVATNLLDKAANGEPVMVAAGIGRCKAALTKAGYTFD